MTQKVICHKKWAWLKNKRKKYKQNGVACGKGGSTEASMASMSLLSSNKEKSLIYWDACPQGLRYYHTENKTLLFMWLGSLGSACLSYPPPTSAHLSRVVSGYTGGCASDTYRHFQCFNSLPGQPPTSGIPTSPPPRRRLEQGIWQIIDILFR